MEMEMSVLKIYRLLLNMNIFMLRLSLLYFVHTCHK